MHTSLGREILLLLIILAISSTLNLAVAQTKYQEEEDEENFRIKTLDNNASIQVVSKRDERIGQAFGIVSVINRREIELFGANSLGEVIDRVVGSYLMSTYLFAENQFSVRGDLNGHFNTRVIVLLNGRPTLGSSTEGIDFPFFKSFPLEAIERIEVQRGPGSVYHGSGAIAGAINIVTRRPAETHEATLELGGGAFSSYFGSFAGGRANLSEKEHPGKDQRISFYTAGTITKDEGWDPSIFDKNGNQLTYDNGRSSYGAFGELYYKGFSINSFLMSSDSYSLTDPASDNLYNSPLKGLKSFINFGFQREYFKNTTTDINITFVEDRAEESDLEIIHSRDVSAEFALRGKIDRDLSYTLGGEVKYYSGGEGEGSFFDEYSSFYYRFYNDIQYNFTDYMKGIVGFQANSYQKLEDSKITPVIGLQMDVLPSISIKAIYSMGYRNPSHLEEGLNAIQGHLVELKPEEIGTFQIQGLAQFDNLLLSTSFYFSNTSDRLFMKSDGKNGLIFGNEDKEITSSGFEFESKIAMFKNWYFTSSFAYMQNQKETDTPRLYWLNSTHSPRYIFKTGISHFVLDRYSIGIFLSKYSTPPPVDDLSWDDSFNPAAEGFTWATANISFNLSKKFKIKAYLTNLFDSEVYYPELATRSARSIPGRSGPGIFLSAAFTFGWN